MVPTTYEGMCWVPRKQRQLKLVNGFKLRLFELYRVAQIRHYDIGKQGI